MKTCMKVVVGVAVGVIVGVTPVAMPVTADRTLGTTETQDLFKQLTGSPQQTWVSAGTIRATHTEYRAPRTTDAAEVETRVKQELEAYLNNPDKPEVAPELQKEMAEAIPFNVRSEWLNEYTMTSTEVVRYDGDRFYWEITIQSRTDSMQPDKSLFDNSRVDRYHPEWNGTRIFTWDGDKYTRYNLPINRVVVDTAGRLPRAVNGPLTAGIIPWGRGLLSSESLASAKSTAVKRLAEGQSQVCLTLQWSTGTRFEYVLDSDKGLAPISANEMGPSQTVSTKFFNHRLVGGRWIPTGIYIERHDRTDDRLLGYDQWTLDDVDSTTPSGTAFEPEYQPGAVVQYTNPVQGAAAFLPERSSLVDTEAVLADRMAVAWGQGTQPQNCATVSLGYVARQLGKPIGNKQLAQSVDANGKTNLYALGRVAKGRGLYSRAVKTDVAGLRELKDCQTILYLPGRDHFVVLAGVEGRNLWLIDLTRSRFVYHVPATAFAEKEWTSGVALLVSARPIHAGPALIDVPEAAQQALAGSELDQSCTRVIQVLHYVFCVKAGSTCIGWFRYYWDLYGCEDAPGYECTEDLLESVMKSPCVDNVPLTGCTVTGAWYSEYRIACGYGPSY